jgi:hypothetical protein
MNFFTSGRRFNFHPAQDSMRTLAGNSAEAAVATTANRASRKIVCMTLQEQKDFG